MRTSKLGRPPRIVRTRIGFVLAACILGAAPSLARATVYQVHVTADDADLGANGTCSLREAILASNGNVPVDGCAAGSPGEDTIVLDAATYTLSIAGTGEDAGATGDLDVTGDLVLAGRGAAMTTVSAAGLGDRVLQVAAGAAVRLQDLTIAGGSVLGGPSEPVAGGGVYNDGQLTLRRAVVSGNAALGGGVRDGGSATGGGVFSAAVATLVLDGSEVTGNRAKGGDGASYCCTDENPCHCFRVGNGGPASGGGIASLGALSVERSVVAANDATGGNGAEYLGVDWGTPGAARGGGIAIQGGSAVVADSVIRSGRAAGGHGEPGAAGQGAGVHVELGSAVLERTLVAENVATGGNGLASILNLANGGAAGGAGVLVASGATARLTNVTLSGNAAGGGNGQDSPFAVGRGGDATGGAVQANGTVAIEHCTLADNVVVSGTSEVAGAALGANLDSDGSTTVVNTILAASYAIAPPAAPVISVCDGASPALSLGGNLESPLATCGFAAPQDQSSVSVAALALGPLVLAGGLSETRAPAPGSVAIGTALASACAERDQRNYVRGAPPCDVGAFETNATSCTDTDHDGFAAEGGACGPGDCEDANPNAHPGAVEIPGNGVDDDCSASTPGCLTPELADASVTGARAPRAWASPLGATLLTFVGLRAMRRRQRR